MSWVTIESFLCNLKFFSVCGVDTTIMCVALQSTMCEMPGSQSKLSNTRIVDTVFGRIKWFKITLNK